MKRAPTTTAPNRQALFRFSSKMRSLFAATLALAAASGSAFLLPTPAARPAATTHSSTVRMSAEMDRRDALSRSAAGAALALLGVAVATPAARAAEEVPLVRDKMGGLLEPYTDIAKVRGSIRFD